MGQISRLRLRFATAGFLLEMRRQFVKDFPGKACPIKNLQDYSPEQRSALMAGVGRAVDYADPSADQKFKMWLELQEANKPENQDGY